MHRKAFIALEDTTLLPSGRGLLACALAGQAVVLTLGGVMFYGLLREHTTGELLATTALFVFLLGVSILALTWASWSLITRRLNELIGCEVRERTRQTVDLRNGIIVGLATLAEHRDTDTGEHLDRIGDYAALLAGELRDDYPFINDAWIERLRITSTLHDIGKVGIRDAILLKPGPLDAGERVEMQQHARIGADTLLAVGRRIGRDAFLDMATRIALHHHEKWDGSGYPDGLAGAQIPLVARIVALADVYDAITSPRVYKPAGSHAEARTLIIDQRGAHFDPAVVDAFERVEAIFDEVRAQQFRQVGPARSAHTPPRRAA